VSEGRTAAWAAGAAAALGAWLWTASGIASLLSAGRWRVPAVAELAAIAMRLPAHLGDPRQAWPAAMAETMPGATWLWSSLLVAGIGLIALGYGCWRAARSLGVAERAERKEPPSARWARRRDLRALQVGRGGGGTRVSLGRRGRELLAAEERQSVIVVAPSQSGKTTGLAIPALLEWRGPVLATSIKSDLMVDSLARRNQLGEVMVFDPAQVSGLPCTRATPLHSCGSWRGAMRMAHWLAVSARAGAGGLRESEFWYSTAEKLLAPLLFAAASGGETMESVVRWLDLGPEASDAEVSRRLAKSGCEEAERAWLANLNREERQRSSVFTTAEIILAAFADPRVIEETSGSDYTPARLLDGRMNTLYLCAPSHEQERLRTLFATMICELLAVAYESAAATGRPIDPPLLLVLDEAANIAPIANLDEIASSGAGQGVQLVSVFQDLAQVRSRYGDRAQTIINNHRAKLFGSGISDPETLAYVSKVIGQGEFTQKSHSRGERGGTTSTKTYRELVDASTLRGADSNSALLLYGNLPPAKVRLRPWYAERSLRQLSEVGAADGRAPEVEW
jgi:type IV secretion system protein VirD4